MTDQTPVADIVERLLEPEYLHGVPRKVKICVEAAYEITHLRTILADMPTIWEDPAGKGYPCQERPMTSAEVRDEITSLRARDIGWRLECEELRAREAENLAHIQALQEWQSAAMDHRTELQRKLDELGATSIAEVDRLATALGQAEGKLQASELAGIVDGWRDRALNAECKLDEAVADRCPLATPGEPCCVEALLEGLHKSLDEAGAPATGTVGVYERINELKAENANLQRKLDEAAGALTAIDRRVSHRKLRDRPIALTEIRNIVCAALASIRGEG